MQCTSLADDTVAIADDKRPSSSPNLWTFISPTPCATGWPKMSPSWPYRFLALSPAEIQHRRELLDLRGYYAQSSAIAIVLLVRVYQSCILLARKSGNGNSERRPLPRPKSWWDMPPCQGWRETRKQYMVALLWLGWLLSLSVWGAGDGMWICRIL